MKQRRTIQACSLVAVLAAVFVLMLIAPANASAQVTVLHVRLTITQSNPARTATYCDTGSTCTLHLWDAAHGFPATGVTLDPGETLVLTQTGLTTCPAPDCPGGVGGNFDTSDTIQPGSLSECTPTNPCTVKVEVDTGGGFRVFNPPLANPINKFNTDTIPNGNETSQYINVPTGVVNYALALGYADNLHTAPCPGGGAVGCLPNPFNGTQGTTAATVFVGAGVTSPIAGSHCTGANCFDAGAILITGLAAEGRMTGGGSVFHPDGFRVTHGFELHCSILDLPNNLEINWGGGQNFHLDALTAVTCLDAPTIVPNPPKAGFDTLIGEGTGTLNGDPATIKFTLTDAGEPGSDDTATFEITQGSVVLKLGPVPLIRGNHQAHND